MPPVTLTPSNLSQRNRSSRTAATTVTAAPTRHANSKTAPAPKGKGKSKSRLSDWTGQPTALKQPAVAPIELTPPAYLLAQLHPSVASKLKRSFDIVGGLVGLLITALIFLPIALAIQLDSPGPVLYSQERCGVAGKRFRIWKFRSMVTDADAIKQSLKNEASGQIFKIADDPRITKLGKFLRRSSLDEFPQFWNVLMGDMSLVGTRPPSVDEVANYESQHWQRLAVKPGITGEWQVHGRSTIKDFEDIVQLDLQYQQKWSVRYDVQLLVKTITVVFKKDGAC
jgi:lipopolysaccharide/colanic/teichoic acid biosynthesis glycosyltransferase